MAKQPLTECAKLSAKGCMNTNIGDERCFCRFHCISLARLSAQTGKDAPSDKTASTPDTWNLSGIDSGGAEYELGVDEDDWDRLEKIGTIYSESWDAYRMEFDDDADHSVDEDDNEPV